MTKYTISFEAEGLGNFEDETALTQQITLAVSKALINEDVLLLKIDIKKPGTSPAGSPRGSSTPGRKPINRPKVEAWIRKNVIAGPSTLGTVGLEGVDANGKPLKDVPNRIYPHRLVAPEPEGVGLSMLAVDKVLRELDTEGYVSRGFAAGAPFYELIRPLPPEGEVGVRGRSALPELNDLGAVNNIMKFISPPATIREVDFSILDLDEDCPGSFDTPVTLTSKCDMCGEPAKKHL